MSSDGRFGPKVLSHRRQTHWPLACALVVAVGGAGTLAIALDGMKAGINHWAVRTLLLGLVVFVFGLVASAVLWIARPTRRRETMVEADQGHVLIANLRMSASGAVAHAIGDGSWLVDVYDGGRLPAVVFHVSSSEEAHALAAAATPSAAEGAPTFRLPFHESRIGSALALAGTAGAVGVPCLFGLNPLGLVSLVVATSCVALMLVPLRVTVGRDAILLKWLRLKWFVALSEVANASVENGRLAIRTRAGHTLHLGVKHHPMGEPELGSTAIARRIVSTLAQRRGEVDGMAVLVSQGDRSIPAWHESLRALRAQGYRHPALTTERLWSMLEHPLAGATTRIGAALLLRGNLDEEGRARLRRFALACVLPDLRHELELLASRDLLAEPAKKPLAKRTTANRPPKKRVAR